MADESIAISTKERVPCIVYLEVAMYGEEGEETEKLNKWWRQKRHPQRHNNFLEKGFQVLTNRMSSISKTWEKIENSFINDEGEGEGEGEDFEGGEEDEENGGGKVGYVPSRKTEHGLKSVLESPGGDSSGLGSESNSRSNSDNYSDNYASGSPKLDGSVTPDNRIQFANMGQWSSPVRTSESQVARGFASLSPKHNKARTYSNRESRGAGARAREGSKVERWGGRGSGRRRVRRSSTR